MAATILVREALRRASYLLGDLSPAQFQRHRESECVDFLNDGALAIVKYLPIAGSRVDAIKLKPGTLQSIETIAAADCKPGDGTTPAVPILGISLLRVSRNMGANGTTPGRAIRIVDQKTLDAVDADWHSASKAATAVANFVADPSTPRYFYVTPPAHASTAVWVELAYTAQPLRVPNTGAPGSEIYLAGGASTATIPLPDEYIDDLVNYVVARASMVESEWADSSKAQTFAGMFLASLNGKVAAITGSNPNLKRLPFAPEPVGAAA
jgi:hypothetical protein